MKKIVISICILSCLLKLNAQGPWTREKGKAYVQLGFTGLFYDKYQLNGVKFNDNHKYTDLTIQSYVEYGISNKLEGVLIVPFKAVSLKSNTGHHAETLSGLGNVTVGLKYKLQDKKWKISSGINYTANTITKDLVKELSTGFNANTILPYISVGSSSGKWYYFGNLGYGHMDNNYSDFLKVTAEVGYRVSSKSHLMFVVDTRNVVSKESAFINEQSQWASYLDRQTYTAIGLKSNYEFVANKYGVNLAIFSATGINNAPLAPTLNLAFYAKF